jgi:hypothetical protein
MRWSFIAAWLVKNGLSWNDFSNSFQVAFSDERRPVEEGSRGESGRRIRGPDTTREVMIITRPTIRGRFIPRGSAPSEDKRLIAMVTVAMVTSTRRLWETRLVRWEKWIRRKCIHRHLNRGKIIITIYRW